MSVFVFCEYVHSSVYLVVLFFYIITRTTNTLLVLLYGMTSEILIIKKFAIFVEIYWLKDFVGSSEWRCQKHRVLLFL